VCVRVTMSGSLYVLTLRRNKRRATEESYPSKGGTVAAEDPRVSACHGASFTVCSNLARQNKKEEKRTSPDAAAGRLEKVREDQRGLGRVMEVNY